MRSWHSRRWRRSTVCGFSPTRRAGGRAGWPPARSPEVGSASAIDAVASSGSPGALAVVAVVADRAAIFYAVDVEGARRLIAFLTEECCEGRPEICGYRRPGLAATIAANRRTVV